LDAELRDAFERVAVISPERRRARLARFWDGIRDGWPFEWPAVFSAIDGSRIPPPEGWAAGGSALGRLESHRQIVQRALSDGCSSMLVMEDDARVTKTFGRDIGRLMADAATVRPAWQVLTMDERERTTAAHSDLTAPERAGWRRVFSTGLGGAYAARGEGIAELYRHCTRALIGGQALESARISGRIAIYQSDPPLFRHETLGLGAEEQPLELRRWLIGGGEPTSAGGGNPAEWCKHSVVLLQAPRHVVARLRCDGWHTGFLRDEPSGIDMGLMAIFDNPDTSERAAGLRRWLAEVGEEADGMMRGILTVWHPQATAELLRQASDRHVVHIVAETVADAITQWEAARP
jgi:hypothetical protein